MTSREMTAVIRRLRRAGFETRLGPGGHWRITRSDLACPVFTAASPSDRRAIPNLLATIRRYLTTPTTN